jgi:hypothetical protein
MNKDLKSNCYGLNAIRKTALAVFAGLAVSVVGCASANAVTITLGINALNSQTYVESGFKVNNARIVTNGCLIGACLSLKDEQSSSLTLVSGNSKFKLTDFWFKLLGGESSLVVDAYNGLNKVHHLVIENEEDHKNNQPTVNFFSLLPGYLGWANLTQVTFSSDDGKVLIDSVLLNTNIPSAVPVPAALPLLASGMLGLSLLGRRRKRAA